MLKKQPKKKPTSIQAVEDFKTRLNEHGYGMSDEEKHAKMIKQLYYIEGNWTEIIPDDYFTDRMKVQQSCIWELLNTERNYIVKMRLVWEVFLHFFRFAKSEELSNIKSDDIFANIDQVFRANDTIWQEYFVKILNETRAKRRPIKPTELLAVFHKTEELFHPYFEFFMKIDACLKRIRDYSDENKDIQDKIFKAYLQYCEELPQCKSNKLTLVSLMTEPVQRMTRYPLLLKAICDATDNEREKEEIQNLVLKIQRFVTRINTRLRKIDEKKELLLILNEFEEYNTWSAGNEDVMWGCVEFLKSDISGLHQKEQRCFLKRECVKLVDKRNRIEMNLEIFLFTDVIVFARRRNSSKKLVVVKQLHYLDRVQFIKSEISPTSIVVIYLDEHGMLASSLMIDMNEKFREGWMEAVEKAQDRYEKAKKGTGSTLDFFQDSKGVTDDTLNIKPRRKTSDLINSVEIMRRMSNGSNKSVDVVKSRSSSTTSQHKEVASNDSKTQEPKMNEKPSTTSNNSSYNGEICLNRRSASWLLTDEKRVRSIRNLLREDLWSSPKQPTIRSSSSFRSDVSDSDFSCGENLSFKEVGSDYSDVSSVSSLESRSTTALENTPDFSRKRTSQIYGRDLNPSEIVETRASPRRINGSSNGLSGISERSFKAEIEFKPRALITDMNQRRSLKTDNNNNHRTPSPRRANSEGSATKKIVEDVFTDSSSSSSEVFDYLQN